MKKFVFPFLFLLLCLPSAAQIDLMGGMGITFINTPTFQDYQNNLVPSSDDVASSFSSTFNFFFETDLEMNKTFDIGIEYENRLYSYTSSFSGYGIYEINYTVHSPSILAYYVFQGEGYKFKFGGGAGYRYLSLDEKLPATRSVENFTSSGFGGVLKAQGHTLLDGDFYAYIGADIRYDLIGEASNENRTLGSQALNREVDFNTLGFGVKLGVSYFIR